MVGIRSRPRLVEMVREIGDVRLEVARVHALDRLCHAQMEPLAARKREVRQQRLTDQLVREREARAERILGPGEQLRALRLLNRVEQRVATDFIDRFGQLVGEVAPDHRGSGERAPRPLGKAG